MLTEATAGTAIATMPMMIARMPAHIMPLVVWRRSCAESVPIDGVPSTRGLYLGCCSQWLGGNPAHDWQAGQAQARRPAMSQLATGPPHDRHADCRYT